MSPAFHAGDRGSNPLGDASFSQTVIPYSGMAVFFLPSTGAGHFTLSLSKDPPSGRDDRGSWKGVRKGSSLLLALS